MKNNVDALKDLFFDTNVEISTDKGYCILERDFTDSELRMLIDSVLFSKNISQKQAKDLIGKLKGLSNKYFSAKVSHVCNLPELQYADRKQQLLFNLDEINDAISLKKKISFTYNRYNTKFQLVPKKSNYTYTVNPYQMVAHNGHYYLICNFDKYSELSHLRIDKMTDVEILNEKVKDKKLIPELEHGLDLSKYMAQHVYMYGGKSVWSVIKCHESLMDELVDWFGKEYSIVEQVGEEISVRVKINEQAMFYWALQYGDCVEVVEPVQLRQKIQIAVERMADKYGK